MRKKFAFSLVILGTITFFALIFQFTQPKDNLVQGKLLSQWTEQLLSSSYIERDAAVAALKEAGPAALPHLVGLLKTKNQPWRKVYSSLAPRFGLRTAPQANIELCQARAAYAIHKLGQVDERTLRALVETLAVAQGDAFYEIERALQIGGKKSESALSRALQRGNITAAAVLPRFTPLEPSTIQVLLQAATSREAPLRTTAAAAVGALALRSPDVAEVLAQLQRDENRHVREAAAAALADNGAAVPQARSALEVLLSDPDDYVRLTAAISHWKLFRHPERVVPVLGGFLQGEYAWQAAYALGDIGPKAAPAIPQLIEALKLEKVPRIMRTPPSASLALGKIGEPAVEALLPLLRSAKPQVQIAALLAIGYMGQNGEKAVREIEPLLKARNLDVRHAAALAMADAGAEGDLLVRSLEEVLYAEDIYMRSSAAKHLRRLVPERDWVVAPE